MRIFLVLVKLVKDPSPVNNHNNQYEFRLGFLFITGNSSSTAGKTPNADKRLLNEADKGLFSLLTNEANRRNPFTLVCNFCPISS